LYKLYVGIDNEQWREVLGYKHADKHYVAVTANSMDDLPLIHEADVTFVSDTETPDTLKQESDVIMLEGGFHVITYAIGAAKAIVARIHAVTEYLFVGFTAVLTSFLAAIVLGIDFPLRLQDMLLCGIIFNFIIAVSLAFAAPNKNILAEKMKKYRTKPLLKDFVQPILYALGAGGAITAVYVLFGNTCALLSSALLLITYGLTNVSKKPLFARTPLGVGKLVVSALIVGAIYACAVYVPPIANLFGYTQPSLFGYGITAAITLGYYAFTQVVKLIYGLIIKNKNKPKFKLAKDEEVN
jgi:magnesium-transporting ATPase (P-type)